MTSFKVGVKTAGDRTWNYNGRRFATREQAEAYGLDLAMRWTAVREYEIHDATEDPN